MCSSPQALRATKDLRAAVSEYICATPMTPPAQLKNAQPVLMEYRSVSASLNRNLLNGCTRIASIQNVKKQVRWGSNCLMDALKRGRGEVRREFLWARRSEPLAPLVTLQIRPNQPRQDQFAITSYWHCHPRATTGIHLLRVPLARNTVFYHTRIWLPIPPITKRFPICNWPNQFSSFPGCSVYRLQ